MRRLIPCALLLLTACESEPATQTPDATVTDASVDAATDVAPDTSSPDGDVVDQDAGPAPGCTWDGGGEDVPEPTLYTPRWAFEPWISKDISDRADTYAFVDGFRDRDIPVGAVVLDSPWETHYNTFVPNPSRYGDFNALVTDMHSRGVRVVLWITQFVNRQSFDFEMGGDTYVGPSPNLEEGLACDFFVNGGATYTWWKGRGASLDFYNPRARAWWHRQQDPLYTAGIDGWKLDFGDSYVNTPTVQTAAGTVPHQEYSESYYRDFYAYGQQRRGREFVTMVRPWDESYEFSGRFFARREHAPVAWVGDNRRDWYGLSDALDHIFRSAAAGYVVVGSDVGGYLDFDDRNMLSMDRIPFSQDTFARWVAVGALNPFMQLHGRGNFAPWTVPERAEETTTLYRYWAKLHHQMVPFWFSLTQEAYAARTAILHPQGEMASWAGDYRYLIGEALLVAPVLDGNGTRSVTLPAGRWYDWWAPSTDAITGGITLAAVDTSNRARVPLYAREGAILPMEVSDDSTGLGTAAQANALTVLVWPSTTTTRFTLHDSGMNRDERTGVIEQTDSMGAVTVTLPALTRPVFLRVRADRAVTAVTVDGAAVTSRADRAALDANPEGWLSDAATRSVWVRLPAGAARTVRLGG
ncbi:MAG: glycoside hydrolase family 31 protein [Polyangiales bacterium]